MAHSKLSGLIIKVSAIFENDLRIVIFSAEQGQQSFIAKRAHKRKLSGKLMVGNIVTLYFQKSRQNAFLSDCDIQTPLPEIRKDLNKISLLFYIINIIQHVTTYNQSNPDLYELLIHTCKCLNTQNNLPHLKQEFETQILIKEGLYNPQVMPEQFKTIFETYTGKTLKAPLSEIKSPATSSFINKTVN